MGAFLHGFEQPRLELREPLRLVFDERREPWLPALDLHDHHSCEVVDRSDLHTREIPASVADLLRRLPREGDEGDLLGLRNPGTHRVAGLRYHRVRLPGPGTGDDEGAVLMDDHRPPLVFVQIGECGVCEPLPEEALIGGLAARLACRAELAVEAPGLEGPGELPPALQGFGESFALLLGV